MLTTFAVKPKHLKTKENDIIMILQMIFAGDSSKNLSCISDKCRSIRVIEVEAHSHHH